MLLTRESAYFWRKNVIAVVILLRVLAQECRSGGNKLSDVWRFIILLLGEGLTFFNINNRTSFFGEKGKVTLSGVSFFWNTRKNLLPKIKQLPERITRDVDRTRSQSDDKSKQIAARELRGKIILFPRDPFYHARGPSERVCGKMIS